MNHPATTRSRGRSRPIGALAVVALALVALVLALLVAGGGGRGSAYPLPAAARTSAPDRFYGGSVAGGRSSGMAETGSVRGRSLVAVPDGAVTIGARVEKSPAAEKRRRLGLAAETPEASGLRIMVKMAGNAVPLDERLDLDALGLRVVRTIGSLDIWVLEMQEAGGSDGSVGRVAPLGGAAADPAGGSTLGSAAAARLDTLSTVLRATSGVMWAELEATRSLTRVPNDDFYLPFGGRAGQWGPPVVGLDKVWDTQTGSPSVVIGVLDSGVGRDIKDFAGRLVAPYSAAYQSTDWPAWEDVLGHGSGTAGVAAAAGDNLVGIAGASWRSGIMPVHLTDESDTLTDEAEVDGIVWAVDHGADVLNLSFGSPDQHPGEKAAIEYALSKGVVVVASAGNGGPERGVWYPAAYDDVIAVGATDKVGDRATFSSFGSGLDLMAPGVDIVTWGADRDSYFMWLMSGTSLSAPLVTGAVSLMLAEDPGLTRQEVNTILGTSADDMGSPGWDEYSGHGLLDAARAVELASTWHHPPTTTTTTPPTTTTTASSTTTTLPPTTTTTQSSTSTTEPSSTTTTTTEAPPAGFSDVPSDHPYAAAIDALATAGVVQGYEDGRFGLSDDVTRQQFAKMVVLALGLTPTERMTAPFTDVPRVVGNLYPDNYVALAYLLGITRGTRADPPLFSPWAPISRAQVTSMVVRGADAVQPGSLSTPPASYLPPFGRFSPAHDQAVARASFNGLLTDLMGMGPAYDMWRAATRGEVAAVLAPLLSVR